MGTLGHVPDYFLSREPYKLLILLYSSYGSLVPNYLLYTGNIVNVLTYNLHIPISIYLIFYIYYKTCGNLGTQGTFAQILCGIKYLTKNSPAGTLGNQSKGDGNEIRSKKCGHLWI